MEKKESPKGERAVKPVISLPSKMGTEHWVLKDTSQSVSQSRVQS